jgi:hypothetical protein
VITTANARVDFWLPPSWYRVGDLFTAPDETNFVQLEVLEAKTSVPNFLAQRGWVTGAEEPVKGGQRWAWQTVNWQGVTLAQVKDGQQFVFTWGVKPSMAQTFKPLGETLLSLFSLR